MEYLLADLTVIDAATFLATRQLGANSWWLKFVQLVNAKLARMCADTRVC